MNKGDPVLALLMLALFTYTAYLLTRNALKNDSDHSRQNYCHPANPEQN